MRLRTEGLRRGALALAMAVLLPGAAAAADLIDHSFARRAPGPTGAVCDQPVVGRFTVAGPGILYVRREYIVWTETQRLQPNTGGFTSRRVAPETSEWRDVGNALGPWRASHRSPDPIVNDPPPGQTFVRNDYYRIDRTDPVTLEVRAHPVCESLWQSGQERQIRQQMRMELSAQDGLTLRIDAAAGNNLAAAPADLQVLWNTANPRAVANGPTRWTEVVVERAVRLVRLTTYHWNGGRGQAPGMIALAGLDGRIHGPWAARGAPGQGGVPNAYWIVEPGIRLPAGRYIVIDSDPATWAQNAGTGGAGMTWAEGRFD